MQRILIIFVLTLLAANFALSEEPQQEEFAAVDETEATEDDKVPAREETKTMSGMSILGNEEAPKSLVIIPWKSSQLGDDISLSDTLADRAQPVDKEVFLRELSFHEIRATE